MKCARLFMMMYRSTYREEYVLIYRSIYRLIKWVESAGETKRQKKTNPSNTTPRLGGSDRLYLLIDRVMSTLTIRYAHHLWWQVWDRRNREWRLDGSNEVYDYNSKESLIRDAIMNWWDWDVMRLDRKSWKFVLVKKGRTDSYFCDTWIRDCWTMVLTRKYLSRGDAYEKMKNDTWNKFSIETMKENYVRYWFDDIEEFPDWAWFLAWHEKIINNFYYPVWVVDRRDYTT